MSQSDTDRNPVEVLAEEFASRVRNGETPSVQHYAEQFPELADEINELFPSIAMMEALGNKEHNDRKLEKSQAVFAATPIKRLGDFRIIRQIGRGGMGVVYEAEQESLGRHVAVKVLGSNAVSSPRQLQRFHREAQAAASLHHTNIVPIFGVGQQDDVHYYVMQLIEGVGLDQIINELSGADVVLSSTDSASVPGLSGPASSSAAAAAEALRKGELVAGGRSRASSNSWSPAEAPKDSDDSMPTASTPDAIAETTVREVPAHVEDNSVDATPNGRGDPSQEGDKHWSAPTKETVDPGNGQARSGNKGRQQNLGDRYWKSVARMGVQLADALEYAHTQNVLHRDIKPANLLLDRHGTVWITDFGLAKHAESNDLTNTGDIVGTLRYMAPEQFNGQCNSQSDIYSLGVTLFELLTMQPAFGESQQGLLIQKITSAGTPSPRALNPSIPRDLETIVLKATANEPNRRYATAGEFADDLQRFLDEVPIRARRVTLSERMWRWSRRNPALAAATATALLLLVLVAIVASWGNLRTSQALDRVSEERDKVQTEKKKAEQASENAEQNLAFALETFRNIISNIASRGVPASLDIELQDGEAAPQETALTEADAQLLQDLVEFFEEFASKNQSDLRAETADAYRSEGDIRRRLGQFAKAQTAYNKALKMYKQLSESQPSLSNALVQAKTMNEIGFVQRDRGSYPEAMRSHYKAVSLLKRQPSQIADGPECRFELVQSYLALASFWEPSGIISQDASTQDRDEDRPPSGRGRESRDAEEGDANRGESRRPKPPSPDGRAKRPESSRSRERGPGFRGPPHLMALKELEKLLADEPDNPEYQLARARAHRLSMRFARYFGGYDNAAAALVKAIDILTNLVEQHPQEVSYKVELVETLLQTPIKRDAGDVDVFYAGNIQQAAKVAGELATSFPHMHQYTALLAGSQRKLGAVAQQGGELELAESHYVEAVEILNSLVENYPAVTVYQIALAQSRQRLGDLKRQQDQLVHSREELTTAVDQFDRFRSQHRINPFYHRIAGSLYESMAETLEALGDSEKAADYREKARRMNRSPWRRRGGRGRDRDRQGGRNTQDPPTAHNEETSQSGIRHDKST